MAPILASGQFVILFHTGKDADHYDLILESHDLCPTFQFESIEFGLGKRIKDHRKLYLTFEGLISPEKGSVSVAEKGTYEFNNTNLTLTSATKIAHFHLQDNNLLSRMKR